MKRLALAILAATVLAFRADAALKPGDAAPDFVAQASLGGKEFTFSLAEALKKGPVVLYFYPAAFTTGCTIEAHQFAEAIDKYAALGASVIGVSSDDIATLNKFGERVPQQLCGRRRCRQEDHDGLRRQIGVRLRQPHVVCHRTRRPHHIRVHRPRSERPCREHARGNREVESGTARALSPKGLDAVGFLLRTIIADAKRGMDLVRIHEIDVGRIGFDPKCLRSGRLDLAVVFCDRVRDVVRNGGFRPSLSVMISARFEPATTSTCAGLEHMPPSMQ